MANLISWAFGKTKAKPDLGEVMPQQTRSGATRMPSMLAMLLADGGGDGTGRQSPGTFETYRKMRRNPTIALARQIATMPCRTGKWTIEADDDAPDEAHDHVEAVTMRLWPCWINWACQSLDFGFQSWETIWEVGPGGRYQPARLKPLLLGVEHPSLVAHHVREAGAKAPVALVRVGLFGARQLLIESLGLALE